jgi:regulator of protease activity HflC (stomatin/prohibitin superfamily)
MSNDAVPGDPVPSEAWAAGPGYSGSPVPGGGAPGSPVPGQTVPGQTAPGQPVPGQLVPGQLVPGQPVPGQVLPYQALPGQAGSGQAGPGLGVPGGGPAEPHDPGIAEKAAFSLPGWPMAGAIAVLGAAGIVLFGIGTSAKDTPLAVVGAVAVVAALVLYRGLTPVAPGQARVVQLLGRYTGTIRTDGLHWVNPASARIRVSTRIRNHETATAKVNDADGSPIEMAAVVVWRVRDTAKAAFGVDDLPGFVATQAETAVRHVATAYPYDSHREGKMSLRDNAQEITAELAAEISNRVAPAGVQIVESRISRLSYAPEIAQAMLRRQQASAVVAARQRIVEGAVGMVESALSRLDTEGIVDLDPERRAAMVSNLLVVLCGEQPAQPVVNTGTLYQ